MGPDFLFLIKNCCVTGIFDKSMEHVGTKEIVPYQLYVPPLECSLLEVLLYSLSAFIVDLAALVTRQVSCWQDCGCLTKVRCCLQVFRHRTPPESIELVALLLEYTPVKRIQPLEACAHDFFDELRDPNTRLPNGKDLPPLYNFTPTGRSLAPHNFTPTGRLLATISRP